MVRCQDFLLCGVSGRVLTRCSTSAMTVLSVSSFGACSDKVALRPSFTDLTRRSQLPPKCGAEVGLKIHSMPRGTRNAVIRSWVALLSDLLQLVVCINKVRNLSEKILLGQPCFDTNRRIAMMGWQSPWRGYQRSLGGPYL